jgi:hypothetical protein
MFTLLDHSRGRLVPGGILIAPITPQRKLQSEFERNTACENGTLRGKSCRVSWSRVLSQSVFFLAAQHGGNIGRAAHI